MKIAIMSVVVLFFSAAFADNKGKPVCQEILGQDASPAVVSSCEKSFDKFVESKKLFTLLPTNPKGKPIKPAGVPQIKDTATVVCEGILGQNANEDLLDSCKMSFNGFVAAEKFLAVAEIAKEKIAASSGIQNAMKQIGAQVIAEAKTSGALVTQGAVEPDLAFDWGVGSVEPGSDGGVVCDSAMDFTNDDEFGEAIPGLYDCKIRGGVWINYTFDNQCSEVPVTSVEQQEQWIDFQIKEDGTIDLSTINTQALKVIQDNCAG